MNNRHYDLAQVCERGHEITRTAIATPQHRRDYCPGCGAKTMTACPSCGKPIRGAYMTGNANTWSGDPSGWFKVPSYCSDCGKPFPWTVAAVSAARELADEMGELTPEDRSQLKGTFDDLIVETPRTGFAVARFKRIMGNARDLSVQCMKQILVQVAADAVKGAIWGMK